MFGGEVHVGEDVFGRVFEQVGGIGKARSKHAGDLLEMGQRGGVIGLVEDRPRSGSAEPP